MDSCAATEWDAFVDRCSGASFYHLYRWREFFSVTQGKETHYLAAYQGKKVVGVLPLVRQKSFLFGDYLVSLPYVNYGGVLADNIEIEVDLITELERLAKAIGVSHAELRGTAPVGALRVKTNKVAMCLNLPATSDELSKRLGAKLRSQIKRPLRESPTILTGGLELVDKFYEVFSRNMRDLGTPVYSKQMFVQIINQFPDDTDIVIVELNDKPTAVGFLLHNSNTTEVPWASSDRRYNRVGVNMLLYWEMLKLSIERGTSVFDFGRSSKDGGTYRFKKQWGAEPVQLHWSYWLADSDELPEINPENSRYSLAIRLWQKMPVRLTQMIGPALARNLP